MFKAVFRLLVLILLLAGWSLAALSLHVVRTPDNVALVPKATLGITDTWVDTRHWTMSDVPRHPAVIHRLEEAGIDPTPGSTPEKATAFIKAELAKWGPIIKASGANID